MAGRYRTDLTYTDFEIAKKFKHNFLKYGFHKKGPKGPLKFTFEVDEIQHGKACRPFWELDNNEDWQFAYLRPSDAYYFRINKKHFRKLVRRIKLRFDGIKQRISVDVVVQVLFKFGLMAVHQEGEKILFRFDSPHQEEEFYLLEKRRMRPEGNIGRKPTVKI